MSDILIKGMEMPKSCYDCDFAYQDQDSEHNVYWTCAAVHKSACMHERREDCPLVSVPPHGRLGDLDALHKLFLEKAKEYKGVGGAMVAMAALCIANAPTIIPAEEKRKEEGKAK